MVDKVEERVGEVGDDDEGGEEVGHGALNTVTECSTSSGEKSNHLFVGVGVFFEGWSFL